MRGTILKNSNLNKLFLGYDSWKGYFIIIKCSNAKGQKENINNLIIFINNLLNNK